TRSRSSAVLVYRTTTSAAAVGGGCTALTALRCRACTRQGPAASWGRAGSFCARLGQRLHQHWQNVAGGNVSQIASDWFSKFNVGIKFVDELPDKRHVDRPRHDVNAVGAHVG